jgi:hypothetical protein
MEARGRHPLARNSTANENKRSELAENRKEINSGRILDKSTLCAPSMALAAEWQRSAFV